MQLSSDPRTATAIQLLQFLLCAELECDIDDLEIVVGPDGHWLFLNLESGDGPSGYAIVIGCKSVSPEVLEGNIIDTVSNSFHREIGYYDLKDWRDVTPAVSTGIALAWVSFGMSLVTRGATYQSGPGS